MEPRLKMSSRTLMLWSLLSLWAILVANGQESKQVEYTLFEETPSNSYMGDIRQNADLSSEFTPDVLAILRYAILTQSSEYAEFFSIDSVDGTLRTAKPIDREQICPQRVDCTINFDIALQPREHFQIIKVSVKVEDVNDNPPSFIENHITRSVPENTQPGARFTLPAADDPDSPKYGVKRYEMVTGSPQFSLNITKTADGSADLQLILVEALDREKRELFTIVIACYDGGLPRKSGLLTVDVIVLDVNDNYPKFDNDTYQVTVPENVSKNSVIIKLRARDPDALANGQVVYSFTSKTQASYGNIFGINNVSGEIFVKDKLDYETDTIYNLAIIAHDKTPEALTGRANVVIKVQDVNDHAPEITINALTTTGHVEISENAPIDSFVAHIAVADPDSGKNGEMSCSMNSRFFDIQPLGNKATEYKIVTTKPLDRETGGFHQVIFICKDQGLPALTSTASIPVTVLDENDHRPIFTKSMYTAIVAENNRVGAFILKVHADDGDTGENAMLNYRLDTDATSHLAIDSSSGNITARVQFDYETKKLLEFTVIATDHGQPAQSSTTVVRLTIRDTNDNSPEFLKDHYIFDVYENLQLGTEVGQVSAKDADQPPFDSFMYFMDPGASATETFVVEPQTGKVFTRQKLDREVQSQYQLVVMAVSQESPSMQSSVKVIIHVADKNDNSPILLFPNPHNDTIHVRSKTPLGTSIAHVIGEDFDIGINSKLTFKIMDGNKDGYFIMDQQSGRIAVREPLTHLEDKLFILKLQVLDNGEPQNKVEAYLNIVVNKSVDHAPIINNSNLKIVISVAVISGILVLALVVAIIFTKRCERTSPKTKYVNQKVLQPKVMMMEAGKQTNKVKASSEPEDNNVNNKREVTFSNDIDLEDERPPPNYTSSPVDKTEVGMSNNKAPVHYDPRSSTYVSLYNARPALSHDSSQNGRLPLQGQPQGQPQGQYQGHQGQPSHPELASTSFDREIKSIGGAGVSGGVAVVPKDRDSDSTGSDASNADSGRGSNEDSTDSRPSMNDSSVTHHNTEGVVLMPPLQPHSHGQSDSFKVRLSSVVKMQHNHVSDQPLHLAPTGGTSKAPQRPPGPPRKPLPPQVPPKDLNTKKPPPPQRSSTAAGYPSAGHTQPQNSKNMTSRQQQRHSDNSRGYHGNTRGYHGHRTSEDETESEYSDEDKEYVYYVNANASHV